MVERDDIREERDIGTVSAMIQRLATSNDWKLAKQILIEKIKSATSLLDMTAEERRNASLCEGRYWAAQIVGEWISQIDGEPLMHNDESDDPETPGHVLRIGQP